jgi:hypothetical protein
MEERMKNVKCVGVTPECRVGRVCFGTVGVFCAVMLSLCPGCHRKAPKPSNPSDLLACTRLEVQYPGGALRQFFPDSGLQKVILNEEESARVRSYDTRTVTDQEQIKALARLLSQYTYRHTPGEVEVQVIITGYRGWRRKVTFGIRYPSRTTERQIASGNSPDSPILAPPELQPLRIRWNCCDNLITLNYHLSPGGPWSNRFYPDPNHWCDIVAARFREWYLDQHKLDDTTDRISDGGRFARRFICPSVQASLKPEDASSEAQQTGPSPQTSRSWISTYAMNPNCRKDSPPDTVFLFESKPGWNQHGGPELFMFDNHDPKGGLVLLNDDKVRFIRTEEELKQLRWK